ncbi:DUF4395 domain-containing protein [Paludibacter sp.]|uniref:DUF4395 domain-containing protein n=1 Tax=Paludibacter sp. TaxID=1898105 RepID=UPI001352F5B7|nr:DUF4395 domain-containing protein [Paludibacter sp.]MTK53172.1 DUF4395 domain-containing protein [Paludibacter sp.]
MQTKAICPINNKKVDENVARSNAALTVLLLVVFQLSINPLIALFLLADFLLRGFDLAAYSPLAFVSKKVVSVLSLKPKVINAGPKFFAAKIGAAFSLSILVSALLGFNQLAFVFSAVFGVCAFLEAAIGFCLACKIYPYTYKLTHFNISKAIQ